MSDATYPTVALLRHAKAKNPTTNMQDFDRPLSDVGKKQAQMVGEFIAKKLKQPLTILCSSALRTRQTLENLQLKNISQIQYLHELYEGNMADYISLIKDNYHLPLLLIGHNPTIAQTAFSLWDKQEEQQKFPQHYKTATLALLSPLKDNGQDLVDNAKLLDIYRP